MSITNLRKKLIRIAALAAMLAAALLLASCSDTSGAELKVTEDLESMRYVELDSEIEAEIEATLSDRGKEFFEMFLGKAGEFDYEITGADTNGDEAVVNVRITTYDFAREYLKSWSEFLEASETGADGEAAEYDTALLYETIFRNLSSIQEKEYTADAAVICTRGGDGSWTTDAASNAALRNAVLGGLLGEIQSLAGLE